MASWILIFGFLLPRAHALENPPIRVRLETALRSIELEGVGIRIYGREKNYQFVAIPQRQRLSIHRESAQGRFFWRVQRNGRSEIFTEPILALKAFELRSGGKSLPNQIFFSSQKQDRFDMIGVLPLENYLVGVLASEMPLSWPLETLKAQAIAARSYALVTMRERSHQVFHVESTILDQVFSHIGSGPDESPLVAKAKEAVEATEGMVLLSAPNRVMKAYYHSDCGGRTASSKSVWGVGSNAGGAVDVGCPSNPRAHWTLRISGDSLADHLKSFLKKPDLGLIQTMELIRPSPKERVGKVRLTWETGEKTVVSSQDLRAVLGYDQMRSTMFDVQKIDNEYQFDGQGFGHGVGLCQWGARYLGRQGKTFEEILSHYYPQARLGSLEIRTEQKLEAQIR